MRFLIAAFFAIVFFPSSGAAQHYRQTNFVTTAPVEKMKRDAHTVSVKDLARRSRREMAEPPAIAHCLQVESTFSIVCRPPTVAVLNSGPEFSISQDNPAEVIFVGEEGTISAWNSRLRGQEARAKIKNKGKAVYKGAAIGAVNGARYLFVGNFTSGGIEVYDSNFHRAKNLEKTFRPKAIPEGFAPTDIRNIDGDIVVTYGRKDPSGTGSLAGAGLGFVSLFSTSGATSLSFEQGEWLNAPHGIAQAPHNFGQFSDAILIGNGGSGQIAAYDRASGKFMGLLRDAEDSALSVAGLWSFIAGPSTASLPDGYIMFSADVPSEGEGAFGMLTPLP